MPVLSHVLPRFGLTARLLGVTLLAGTTAFAATAQTSVAPGDTLSVTVVESPDLGREAKVNAAGEIMLPQIGSVAVAGEDLEAIRDDITDLLVERDIVLEPTVLVEIAAYRPIYVGGSVAQPGAVAYEPGLTVRRALILAGGLALGGETGVVSAASLLETRAKAQAAAYRLAQVESRIARLEAELAHSETMELPARLAQVPKIQADAIASLEIAQLDDRYEAWNQTAAHLEDSAQLLALELDVLNRQAELQESDRDLQAKEVENARSLLERGLIPEPRLRQLERENSALSRDILDNQAFAARARQNQATLLYEREAAETTKRLEIRDDISTLLAQKVEIEAEITSFTGALLAAGTASASDPGTPAPAATIYRMQGDEEQAIPATMQTFILPGDVLEIALEIALPG